MKNPSFISLLPLPHISFPSPLNAFYFYFSILHGPASILLLLPHPPTLFDYLITMHNIITNTPTIVPQLQQAALSEILKLQQAALYEISQLNLPRQQVLEMEVQLRVPNLEASCDGYVKQDICLLSQNFKLSKARIYFPPQYTPDKKGRLALYHDIRRAAQDGVDSLTLWGKGRGKEQSMYIRCQCAPLYRGSKTDKQGSVVPRADYRATTFTNDRKNQRHGIKGINGSHRTTLDRRTSKGDERCPFSCSIFLDSDGYYLKTATNSFLHQFHARRDHIRTSTTLLDVEENQIQGDLSSARAKTGVAANLHYVRSGRQGTTSILSHAQIKALLKKNPHQVDGNDADESINGSGEIDDLYQFLEKSGSHYVSLLARVVPEQSVPPFSDSPSTADSPCQPTQIDSPPRTVLFNETRLGHTKDQEDIVIAADEEQDMLRVVSVHGWLLPISDSQEMMVGIAYAMPYEVRQFRLFNVCLHIDATADSNKEGWPLVTVSSKDSYGKMFIVLRAFLPNEQSWSYKWFFQTVLPALLGKDVLKRIKIIVTGGDSQEISQLDDALASFFPEAYRIRCSWHIIDRG